MNSTSIKTQAQLLHDARVAAGLSQRQLAEKSGVRRGQISQIETGKCGITAERAKMFVSALGLSEDFFASSDKPTELQSEFIDFVSKECMFETFERTKEKVSERFGISPDIEISSDGSQKLSAYIDGKKLVLDIAPVQAAV